MRRESLPECAVLLAGGRGTRFWPRSRLRAPKQVLNIVGRESMLRQTAARLAPLFPARYIWAVTNREQTGAVRRELHGVPSSHILAEPVGRNTAAAIGLAAVHLTRASAAADDALMAVLPSDHHIANAPRYRKLFRVALALAGMPGNLVVMGIPPTRPETGYGYIELGDKSGGRRGVASYAVRRFMEKPSLAVARKYAASGKYLWNAGMFFWRASTFLESLRRFLPETYDALNEIAKTIGTRKYEPALRGIYPRLQNISVDYAIMEPATRAGAEPRVFVIPANVGWSDIGSWNAVYELAAKPGANVSAGPRFTLDSHGNYFWSPGKFVAAIGVDDLVMIETDDAVLICARERSQDVSKIVAWLEQNNKRDLL